MTKLSKKIMRRVYYAYALKLVTQPVLAHALILGASFFVLTQVVSVPDVWRNLMQVPVGDALGYLLGALMGTQMLTIVLLAVITSTLSSLLRRLLARSEAVWDMDERRLVG